MQLRRLADSGNKEIMNTQQIKNYALALTLTAGFVVAFGLSGNSAAQAQDGRYNRDRHDDQGERDRRQADHRNDQRDNRIENRHGRREDRRDDRWNDRRDNHRNDGWNNRRDDRWDNRNGSYGNNGRYGTYGRNDQYGYGNYGNSAEEQKGFRDGLDRGQEDARDRRRADPNNSSHFQKGSAAYREGFRRGYVQGYRQNGNYGRW